VWKKKKLNGFLRPLPLFFSRAEGFDWGRMAFLVRRVGMPSQFDRSGFHPGFAGGGLRDGFLYTNRGSWGVTVSIQFGLELSVNGEKIAEICLAKECEDGSINYFFFHVSFLGGGTCLSVWARQMGKWTVWRFLGLFLKNPDGLCLA